MVRLTLQIFALLLLGQNTAAQKFSKTYFLGKWTAIDSASDGKYQLNFKDKQFVEFLHPSDSSTWKYKLQSKGSTIVLQATQDVDYTVNDSTHSARLLWDFVILIQDKNYFWLFTSRDYEIYLKRQRQHDSFETANAFEEWLKEARQVYYRDSLSQKE